MQGHIHLMKANLRASEESFQHLLRVNPENSTAYFYLAEISRQNKSNRQALRYLEKALTYNPQLKNAYIMASQIYEAEGDFENAAKYKQYAEQF
jgi:tetratricopeptide (TPR) repeat protein